MAKPRLLTGATDLKLIHQWMAHIASKVAAMGIKDGLLKRENYGQALN